MPVELNATESRPYSRTSDHLMPQIKAFLVDCITPAAKHGGVALRVSLEDLECAAQSLRSTMGETQTEVREDRTVRQPERRAHCAEQIVRPISESVTVRGLVRYVSHNFNNILMGIWGNLYLIRLSLEDDHPLQPRIAQTEHLIQDGSFFIHLILGYLAERRTLAKRLRLIQMVSEMAIYVPDADTRKELLRQLQTNAALRRPQLVAENTSKIMDQLLHDIEALCNDMAFLDGPAAHLEEKVQKIEMLASRARELTQQLDFFAGREASGRTCFNLKNLLFFKCRKIKKDHPDLLVSCSPGEDAPACANRRQIAWMLNEVVDTACRTAMNDGSPQVVTCAVGMQSSADRQTPDVRRFEIRIERSRRISGAPQRVHQFRDGLTAIGANINRSAVERILKAHGGGYHRCSEDGRQFHHIIIPELSPKAVSEA